MISDELYLKDPQQSTYGQHLLKHSVALMAEIGFEHFNFKKLAEQMGSTETSVYRYFENKQKLLIYLSCWYWEWVHYLIDIHTMNIEKPTTLLKIAIHQLIYASEENSMTAYINENFLHQLLVIEGVKSFHFSDVDKQNEAGVFRSHKDLISKITSIITKVNPSFTYGASLASTLTDMAHNQIYYAKHLPRLSSVRGDNILEQLEVMMQDFAFSILGVKETD